MSRPPCERCGALMNVIISAHWTRYECPDDGCSGRMLITEGVELMRRLNETPAYAGEFVIDDDVAQSYRCAEYPEVVVERVEQQSQMRCPKCGRSMERRKGRNGWFWGCVRYPMCKATRQMAGVRR